VSHVEIPLTRGLVAIVDAADAERVLAAGKWHAIPGGHTFYGHRNFRLGNGRGVSISLHRFLTGWPLADHANGNGLDNRRQNLRQATSRQNAQNRRLRSDSNSGYKGVNRSPSQQAWRAHILANGRRISLGSYQDPVEAARAYDAAARHYFGEFAALNFPGEEPVGPIEGLQNRLMRTNRSGYRGVSWYKSRGRWVAQIVEDGRKINLGYFDDPVEAARVYDAAARKYHGVRARLNFPEGRSR
jgi:hypothetical protein